MAETFRELNQQYSEIAKKKDHVLENQNNWQKYQAIEGMTIKSISIAKSGDSVTFSPNGDKQRQYIIDDPDVMQKFVDFLNNEYAVRIADLTDQEEAKMLEIQNYNAS